MIWKKCLADVPEEENNMLLNSNRKKRQIEPIPVHAPVPYQKLVYILALDKIFQENKIKQIE